MNMDVELGNAIRQCECEMKEESRCFYSFLMITYFLFRSNTTTKNRFALYQQFEKRVTNSGIPKNSS